MDPYIGAVVLSSTQVEQIAQEVATEHLSPGVIDAVSSEETVDSQGRDAVRITITLKAETAKTLTGDGVLDTLVAIQTRLAEKGDQRLPIVEYEEVGELSEADDDGDAQS